MNTTAELHTWAELYNTDLVAVLLTEECYCSQFACLLNWSVTELLKTDVLTNHRVHQTFHLAQFLIGNFLEMREVEAQRIGAYERTLLLHMVAQHLFKSVVKQVSGGMVSGTCVALVGVNASHEVCLDVLRQLLHNVNALSVLTFCIDDVHSLVLAYEHTLIAYLTTHFPIERCVVKNQLIESALLLCHLAIASDVALIFCVVITYKLLLGRRLVNNNPVAILHRSSVAGALFLLLHLDVEAFFVNGIAVLAADKFCKVERETISVEQFEGICSVELCLSFCLQFSHAAVEHANTAVECAQERVFLLLYHASDKLALCLKFGISVAHFMHEHWDKFEEERLFLSKECICIAHGTAQDTADYISCLCVSRQLSVGN